MGVGVHVGVRVHVCMHVGGGCVRVGVWVYACAHASLSFPVLGIEPRASCMLHNHYTTELPPTPLSHLKLLQ
jgi:hypothetical protein